ncbi:MAG: hypothetical protein VR73_04395 [Gammaproteobacteria bacterium BRH_c0]|nr:MAG: hypothetical protein VR73_04395 [Gammaproteobacteria bacterium BRH_c0]
MNKTQQWSKTDLRAIAPAASSVAGMEWPAAQQWLRSAVAALVLLIGWPLAVLADFGTYIEAPEGGQWIRLSSFTWEQLPENVDPKAGEQIDARTFMSGRIAPQQGPALVVAAKPVSVAIPGLSDHCSAGTTLPVVRFDVPVWDTRFPTDEMYYQRYELQQVEVQDCQHIDGAVADAIWLKFATLEKEGEPRPRQQ